MEEFFNNKFGGLEVSKDLQKFIKPDLLVSYKFTSSYLSAQADRDSTWLGIYIAYPL